MTSGLSSLAQAVLDHSGHPTAAVAVTYLAKEVDHRTEASLVEAVTGAAFQLSRRLGFRGAWAAASRVWRQPLTARALQNSCVAPPRRLTTRVAVISLSLLKDKSPARGR